MITSLRKQGRKLLLIVGAYLLFALVFNALVNPLRMMPAAWSLAWLDDSREIGEDLRTGKAGLVRYNPDTEIAVVGSSRFEIGVDPTNAAFGGAKTLNLAMAAAGLHENVAMTRYLMSRAPGLRTLVYGIDLGNLSSDSDSRKFTNFYSSPLAQDTTTADMQLRYALGVSALKAGFSTVERHVRNQAPSRTSRGLWISPAHPENLREYLVNNREVIFGDVERMWSLRSSPIREDRLEELRRLWSDLGRRGVKVVVIIPPQLALKQLHPFSDVVERAPWENERRALFKLCQEINREIVNRDLYVELWDFATYHEVVSHALPAIEGPDKRMAHWFDMGHFDLHIGNRMIGEAFVPLGESLRRTMGEEFGVNVLEVGIEAHLDALKKGHARYCHERPDDVAWVRACYPFQTPGIK